MTWGELEKPDLMAFKIWTGSTVRNEAGQNARHWLVVLVVVFRLLVVQRVLKYRVHARLETRAIVPRPGHTSDPDDTAENESVCNTHVRNEVMYVILELVCRWPLAIRSRSSDVGILEVERNGDRGKIVTFPSRFAAGSTTSESWKFR